MVEVLNLTNPTANGFKVPQIKPKDSHHHMSSFKNHETPCYSYRPIHTVSIYEWWKLTGYSRCCKSLNFALNFRSTSGSYRRLMKSKTVVYFFLGCLKSVWNLYRLWGQAGLTRYSETEILSDDFENYHVLKVTEFFSGPSRVQISNS